jgi:bifunctional UDP-N-acetylglucosamine pyrophosphorylase/glucosamine-1-phosphate N-acetyltransferase
MQRLAVVILAAGQSKRMKSKTSKVLHPLAGLPLVSYPIREAGLLKPQKVVVVVGKGQKSAFQEKLNEKFDFEYCIQNGARGTGDAVISSKKYLKDHDGHVLILPGDVPLITSTVIAEFIKRFEEENVDCAVISTLLPDPTSYGRILRDESGEFVAIREEKDASGDEKGVNEINTGIFLARSKWLFKMLQKIKPHNAQKEYYLTDVVELAISEGRRVFAHLLQPHDQFLGVNDRFDLAYSNKLMSLSIAEGWMERGVSIQDPDQTYIDYNVKIGQDTVVAPFTFLKGSTTIGKGCLIEAGAVLEDVTIGDNVHIKPYSVIEKSQIKEGAVVGPFSRVRPDSLIDKGAKVGNFVEIKKSVLKPGVKANHLSYIGDATIGAKTNVGCGTITCNYDGVGKHRTVLGEDVFVGSDVQFVAPVKVGKGSVIGAGSTITKNVPAGSLALSRAEQVNVKGWALKHKKKKK